MDSTTASIATRMVPLTTCSRGRRFVTTSTRVTKRGKLAKKMTPARPVSSNIEIRMTPPAVGRPCTRPYIDALEAGAARDPCCLPGHERDACSLLRSNVALPKQAGLRLLQPLRPPR